jgi:hypothetical protein
MKMEGWGTGSVIMTSCNLLGTDGALTGTNRSGTSGMLSATTVIYGYGSTVLNWGANLTPTLVTNANFGVGVRMRSRGASGTAKDIWIDYITLEIWYDCNQTNVKFVEC